MAYPKPQNLVLPKDNESWGKKYEALLLENVGEKI